MNKTINLKQRKIRFTEIVKLGKRIEEFAKLSLTNDNLECFEALIMNYQEGNFRKAEDIANMLETSLNNQCICQIVERNFTIIK